MKGVKLTLFTNRNGKISGVTDIPSGHFAHLPNRNEKPENKAFHFQ